MVVGFDFYEYQRLRVEGWDEIGKVEHIAPLLSSLYLKCQVPIFHNIGTWMFDSVQLVDIVDTSIMRRRNER